MLISQVTSEKKVEQFCDCLFWAEGSGGEIHSSCDENGKNENLP